jgi:hypothetical protein
MRERPGTPLQLRGWRVVNKVGRVPRRRLPNTGGGLFVSSVSAKAYPGTGQEAAGFHAGLHQPSACDLEDESSFGG